jgi:hypothetical protein
LVENHEFCASLFQDPFDEFQSEPTHSVAVGNHNRVDFSVVDSFQKGSKVFAVPVKTGADVGKEFMVRELMSEILDLSLEIGLLFVAGYSSVADALFRFLLLVTKDGVDFGLVVESLTMRKFNDVDSSVFGPSTKSTVGDTVLGSDLFGGDELCIHRKVTKNTRNETADLFMTLLGLQLINRISDHRGPSTSGESL